MSRDMVREFELTAEHITLLRAAYIGWEDCKFGAPAIDCKRPYGNSSVEADIAEILGWTPEGDDGEEKCLSTAQNERAREIHRGTQIALQIILVTGEMKPGRYRQEEQYDHRSWKLVSPQESTTASASGEPGVPAAAEFTAAKVFGYATGTIVVFADETMPRNVISFRTHDGIEVARLKIDA